MSALYNISIAFYTALIRLAALFSPKAKAWVRGRRGWKKQLKQAFDDKDRVAWFHAASLGEFEQGRPVIEAFRKQYPDYKILLTFFSPSGYEQKKNYDGADTIMYLPADCMSNARYFVRTLNPAIAIFIKYEFWYNYLTQLKKIHVPVIFISVLLRDDQIFFKGYGHWFREKLRLIDHFFVQDEDAVLLLDNIGIKAVTVSGDTRFDRVADILEKRREEPGIKAFCEGSRVLIAGSTWPPDEKLLAGVPAAFPELKIIIAPHEVKEDRIASLIKTMNVPFARYSMDDPASWMDKKVLVIDTIGLLSSIYQYADIAYVGGAFATGLHNIQEPAVNGMPVIFGPKYHKFREAVDLVKKGGAFTINTDGELIKILHDLLNDESRYRVACATSRQFMLESTGATQKIMSGIQEILNPSSIH